MNVLVLGDSHSVVFETNALRDAIPEHQFEVLRIGGATAGGIKNPISKTLAAVQFKEKVAASEAEKIVVLLGEVDCGLVAFWRAEKYGVNVSETIDDALDTYKEFLRWLTAHAEVVCVSAPLPTTKDGRLHGLRPGAPASQHLRTQWTVHFNSEMESFCENQEYVEHINLDRVSIGADGLVDQALVHSQSSNHHYCPNSYAGVLAPELKKSL